MREISFSDAEIRLLRILALMNPCACGCAFEEYQKTDVQCNECVLKESIENIKVKLR